MQTIVVLLIWPKTHARHHAKARLGVGEVEVEAAGEFVESICDRSLRQEFADLCLILPSHAPLAPGADLRVDTMELLVCRVHYCDTRKISWANPVGK